MGLNVEVSWLSDVLGRQLVTATLLNAGLTLLFACIYLVLLFVYDTRMALAALALTLVIRQSVMTSGAPLKGPPMQPVVSTQTASVPRRVARIRNMMWP